MLFPGGFYYLVLKPRLGLIIIVLNFTKDILKETFIKIKEKEFFKLLAIKSKVKPPFSDYGYNFSELFELIVNNIVEILGWILCANGLVYFFSSHFIPLINPIIRNFNLCVFRST